MRRVLTVALRDPDNALVLIEGLLFRASYLGSTQLTADQTASKPVRMMQAQEAVGRVKVVASLVTPRRLFLSLSLSLSLCDSVCFSVLCTSNSSMLCLS